jgi:hypothetical protein
MKIKEIKDDKLVIKYQGRLVKVNITEELLINENTINSQLKESPSSYAFLTLLRARAIKDRDKLDREKEIAYSEAYIYYKDSGSSNMTNEKANHKANTSPKYISIYKKWLKACYVVEKLSGVCRSYEGREKIMQTLSANLRKER